MAIGQCPNCGGFKVKSYFGHRVDPATGESVESRADQIGCGCGLLLVVLLAAIVAFMLAVGAGSLTGAASVRAAVAAAVVSLIGLIILLITVRTFVRAFRAKGEGDLLEARHYYCDLCGYDWWWEEGDPWPSVTVRPDLIRLGEERLREEEERRRLLD